MDTDRRAVLQTLFEIDDLNLLFIGAGGAGKTTLLYAIIREYYGFQANSPIPETNIFLINNLKEQGINYFRNEMKTFCQSQCSIYGKKKMIVIDDLETINEQSQQVFRNYIDKYRHNIHFVAVASTIQKVIESIQSRVHILQIRSPNDAEIRVLMDRIIEEEGLSITEDAKTYILSLAEGSVRVVINYLEKFFIYGQPIELENCKQMCSNISTQTFDTYMDYLFSGNLNQRRIKSAPADLTSSGSMTDKDMNSAPEGRFQIFSGLTEATRLLYSLYDNGYSVIDILDYFFTYIKAVKNPDISEDIKYRTIPYICKHITIFNKMHEDALELAFFTNGLYNEFIDKNLVK